MDIVERFKEKARQKPKVIVLPEGGEDRVLRAAEATAQEGFAYPVLLGDEEAIRGRAASLNLDLANVEVVNPLKSPKIDSYAKLYFETRRKRGVTERLAKRILGKSLYFGAMMVHAGDCDGMVAGAANLTASVIRAGHLIVGLDKGVSTPSSFFIIETQNLDVGEKGLLLFADAAVNPDPNPSQLADIAISSAKSAQLLLDWEPRIAMLSFSTHGSAFHALTKKVVEATNIARERMPNLLIDGELQADAAINLDIARRKVKESSVAGKANILIFPDLNAGNIAYKLVQYVAKAEAYGPILQGFAKPLSDLSRGASVNDIVGVIAIIAVLAQGTGYGE